MPPPVPAVEFRSVAKRFGHGPLVLDAINLTAQPGDFISIIGPSGSGKSTLLRLLAGLASPSSGEIFVNGALSSVAAGEIGFVFQEPTLLPWLDVAANIELPLALRHTPAATRNATRARLLSLVRLDGRERAYPRQLSGGQKMRVSLARALTLSPKLLLLDEPFGALDEITRHHLNEELLALRELAAWTAFFVTHSVAEAVFLSNRILVLSANPGRIHAEIRVDLAFPRTAETRLSSDYLRLVAETTRALRSVENVAA